MSSEVAYRPEIDGLRAVAVLAVVLYHFNVWPFSGGYVGVDIFFVISGYLITLKLVGDLAPGGAGLVGFYSRRVRRILPALVVLLGVVFVVGCFVLLTPEMTLLGESIAASAAFVSNIYFYGQTGYFGPAAETMPLLHLWSLSVEEQFYIAFPLLFWLASTVARRWVPAILAAGILIGLGVSYYLVRKDAPAAFFLFQSRFWELGLGALVAVLPASKAWRFRGVLTGLGAALIAVAILVFNETTLFPGLAALPPCLGTAAIIFWGRSSEGIGRALAWEPMRLVGLLSYSLYLWHWPVVVYSGLTWGELGPAQIVGGLVLSFGLSYLSWRFVEKPFRRPASWRSTFGIGLVALVIAGGVGVWATSGLAWRLPERVTELAAAGKGAAFRTPGCWGTTETTESEVIADCLPASPAPKVVIWGDSHAHHYAAALNALAGANGMESRLISRGGCTPQVGAWPVTYRGPDGGCRLFNEATLSAVLDDPTIKVVILSGRWARYMFPHADPEFRGLVSKADAAEPLGLLTAAVIDTIEQLKDAGKTVVLIGSVPEFYKPLPACLARAEWHDLDVNTCTYRQETLPGAAIFPALAQIAEQTGVTYVDPEAVICPDGVCHRLLDGMPVSHDTDHLSERAAQLVLGHSLDDVLARVN